MTWTPRKPEPIPESEPKPSAIPICQREHCAILSCCQQAGRCLGWDIGGVEVEGMQ
jgi:hypothetical protein